MFLTPIRKRKISNAPSTPYKKVKFVSRVPRSVGRGTHATFFRSGYADLTVANQSALPYGFAFNSSGFYINDTLNSWSGATDISNAFDAYRINKVVVEFTYNQNTSNVNQSANTLPWLFSAVDYDDAGGVAGANITRAAIVQKDGARVDNFGTGGGNKIVRSFVPKIAVAAYATAAVTGYMEPKAKQWISTGTLGTGDPKHYGLWTFLDNSDQTANTGTNGYCRIFIKVYFEAKHAQ